MKLIENNEINHILDVGANFGQYGLNTFASGYKGKISSFEPVSKAYSILNKNAKNYTRWNTYQFALGNIEGESEINISGNSVSSSILDMLPQHVKSAPDSSYIGKEKIQIKTLDAIFNDIIHKGDNIYLKVDTQGYEKMVIEGAEKSLSKIKLIQLELSLVHLYSLDILFEEMVSYMKSKNFTLVSLEDGFTDKTTGQLLQIDGIFKNNSF
jgi:FkbM family methyltransferase